MEGWMMSGVTALAGLALVFFIIISVAYWYFKKEKGGV